MSADLHGTVSSIAEAMADAWNRADSEAYGELFATDADFIEIRGGHHVGRDAIAAGHRALWDSIYAGSTVTYEVETVRSLGEGVGVGVIGARMEAPTGPLAGTNPARMTVVVTDDDGTWRIVAFHNTLVLGVPAAP